jgi:hypothetical protein
MLYVEFRIYRNVWPAHEQLHRGRVAKRSDTPLLQRTVRVIDVCAVVAHAVYAANAFAFGRQVT